jgi:hypothetical protein
MKITTNNQPRDLLSFWDLSDKEQRQARSDFEWLEDIESDYGFFRYRGQLFHLANFTRSPQKGWDGHQADSYFSGTLVRLSADCEAVTVGRWLS